MTKQPPVVRELLERVREAGWKNAISHLGYHRAHWYRWRRGAGMNVSTMVELAEAVGLTIKIEEITDESGRTGGIEPEARPGGADGTPPSLG